MLPLQHAQGQSCFAVGRSLCAPGHTCGHTRTHPRAHPGTRGFSQSQDEPCTLTEVPDCHCGLALDSGAHRSQVGHYTVVGAGTVEGMGCRLGAPRALPSEMQVSIQGSHVQSTAVSGETALQTAGSAPEARWLGLQPAPWAGGQTHGEVPPLHHHQGSGPATGSVASDVESSGPRRAEGRMDLTVPSAQHRPGPPHSSPRSCLFP